MHIILYCCALIYSVNRIVIFPVEPANQMLLYPCPNNCGKRYKFKSSLSGHFKYECGKSPMYKCPYCKKRCSLKGNLKRHIILMHHRNEVESDFNIQFTTKTTSF